MRSISQCLTTMCLLILTTTTATSTASAEPTAYLRSDGQFVAKGSEYPRSFWTAGIYSAEGVFSADPAALQEYQDHMTDAKWFGILNWGSIGVFATYAIASGKNYESGVGLALFLVPWFSGVIMAARSNSHLIKAINLINGVPPAQALAEPPTQLERHDLSKQPLMVPLIAWSF